MLKHAETVLNSSIYVTISCTEEPFCLADWRALTVYPTGRFRDRTSWHIIHVRDWKMHKVKYLQHFTRLPYVCNTFALKSGRARQHVLATKRRDPKSLQPILLPGSRGSQHFVMLDFTSQSSQRHSGFQHILTYFNHVQRPNKHSMLSWIRDSDIFRWESRSIEC